MSVEITANRPSARILHVSDWHCNAREAINTMQLIVDQSPVYLKPDFIVVTGDMVENQYALTSPSLEAQEQAMVWADMVQAFHRFWPGVPVVAVAGNHEFCHYWTGQGGLHAVTDSQLTFTVNGPAGDDALVFTGFRGVPKWREQWDREYDEKTIAEILELCDPNADVLITHTPSYRVRDMTRRGEMVGSKALEKWLKKSKVKLHCFGHIHEAAGVERAYRNRRDKVGYVASNAALGWNWLTLP